MNASQQYDSLLCRKNTKIRYLAANEQYLYFNATNIAKIKGAEAPLIYKAWLAIFYQSSKPKRREQCTNAGYCTQSYPDHYRLCLQKKNYQSGYKHLLHG